MSYKPKVLFAIPTMSAGGSERILSFLAQHVNEAHFETHLLIIGRSSESSYEFDSAATTFLNKNRVLNGIPAIVAFLFRYKPNIVVSTLHLNLIFGLMAPFFQKCKFIGREASVISEMGKFYKENKLLNILSRIAYKNFDNIVCQSQDMADDFKKLYKLSSDKTTIINNPITKMYPIKNESSNNGIIKFITVGRLSKEKGHQRILDILAQLNYSFRYTIVGSGPEEANIRLQISNLGLKDMVQYIPFTKEVGLELSKHDVFLQGSYVEGFPNAVLESCVVGTPAIAFNVLGGTKEIIENGINGILVENEAEYYAKLSEIHKMNWEAKQIRDSVINKFDHKHIMAQYEFLFLKVLNA